MERASLENLLRATGEADFILAQVEQEMSKALSRPANKSTIRRITVRCRLTSLLTEAG